MYKTNQPKPSINQPNKPSTNRPNKPSNQANHPNKPSANQPNKNQKTTTADQPSLADP